MFVQSENELESCPAWHALTPPPPAGLMESTAKFSKQLLGLEQSVLDPVQVSVHAWLSRQLHTPAAHTIARCKQGMASRVHKYHCSKRLAASTELSVNGSL